MKIREKIESFSVIAMRAAADTNAAVQAQLDAELVNACEQAAKDARLSASIVLNEERQRAEQEKNRAVLEASAASRKTLIALRSELTERLFARVEDELAVYAGSVEYAEAVVLELTALAEKYPDGVVVSLCARDMKLAAKLDSSRVSVVQGADVMLGGYIAQVNGSAVRFDCSFAQGLADARAAFNGFKIAE